MKIRKIKKPILIEGGLAVDDRGCLTFINDFDFNSVKRFYIVENFSTKTIRAFHGHLKEVKFILVVAGSAMVAAVQMKSKKVKINRFVLSDKKPAILYIPAGFANGFRPLEKGTKILFFSTATLKESKGDDYRFPADHWGADIWKVENR